MKRKIGILTGIVLLINIAFVEAFSLSDTLETKTVLYKISDPKTNKVSFVFGTHHAFGKPFFEGLKSAKDLILTSDLFIKENLNIPGNLAEDVINRRSSTIKWSRYLEKEDYQYVKALFSSSKLNFGKMTPAELFVFLNRRYNETVCVGKEVTANYFSLDDYMASVARSSGIEVIGLETTEDQIRLINDDIKGMPRKVHKKRLSRMIARIKSGTKDNCAQVDWYRNMDFDFKMDAPCTNQLMLTNRNDKWMDKLKTYLKTNNCFIAVGLSHLMFDCGLLKQLCELGYIIEPVMVK